VLKCPCQVVDFDRNVHDGWGQDTSAKEVYKGKSTKCTVCGLSPGCRYLFRVRLENQFGASEWSALSQFTTEAGPVFYFDKANCGPAINISEDRLSASFTSSETWSTVLGTTPFVVGRNSWQIRLDKSQTAYLFVGVATKDANLSSFLGGDENGWGYIGDRALYHRRNKIKAYGDKFVQGDTIGVTLDLDSGTLSFSKNDVDLGVAFDNLAGELYPAVAFYNHGQSVSLTGFNCPGAGVTIEGSPSHATVNDVAEVQKVMRSFVTGQSLPSAFADRCFEEHAKWQDGTTVRCTTRSGFDLQFDTSDAALAPFPFHARQKFATARGAAEIVGVADHKLWFVVEGETGAWFLSRRELVQAWEAKEATGNVMVSPTGMPMPLLEDLADLDSAVVAFGTATDSRENGVVSSSTGGTELVETTEGRRGGGGKKKMKKRGEKADDATAVPMQPASARPPAVEDFAEWPVPVGSMLQLDSHITAAVGFHCHKQSLSPWNLPMDEYLEIVKKNLPKGCEEACRQCARAKKFNLDTALILRYSVLKVFNDKFSKILEFVDLSRVVELSTRRFPSLTPSFLPFSSFSFPPLLFLPSPSFIHFPSFPSFIHFPSFPSFIHFPSFSFLPSFLPSFLWQPVPVQPADVEAHLPSQGRRHHRHCHHRHNHQYHHYHHHHHHHRHRHHHHHRRHHHRRNHPHRRPRHRHHHHNHHHRHNHHRHHNHRLNHHNHQPPSSPPPPQSPTTTATTTIAPRLTMDPTAWSRWCASCAL
jgi:hypothetical protein